MSRTLITIVVSWALLWGLSPASADTCLSQSSVPSFQSGQSVPQVCDTHGTQKVMTVDEDGNYVAGGVGGGGDASAANQTTIIGHVDGVEGLLGTIDADTGNIASGVGTTADEESTAGGEGTISAKLRNATALLDTLTTALSTLSAKLPSAAAMADNESNPTLSSIAAYLKCWDTVSSNWDRCGKATSDTDGVQTVRPHAPLTSRVSGRAAITDGSSTSVVAAQGASTRFCATTIIISNSSATNVEVDIRDGTAGTVLMTIPAAANMGGAVVSLAVPICTTANTIFAADPSASASTVTVTAVGYSTTL